MSDIRNEFGILLLLGAAHSLNHSLFLVIPPLLEIICKDLDTSFQTMGTIVTVSFFLYGLGSLAGGQLSDRLGEIKIVSLSIILSGISTLVFFVSKSIHVFSFGMFLIAIWASFYHPTANTLISKHFTKNTARVMGVHGAAAGVGQMFTPAFAYVLGSIINWRVAFAFFGAISVITGLLMRRMYSDYVEVHRSTARSLSDVSLSKLFKVPNFLILILYNIVIGLFLRGVELFFPTFLVLNRGLTGQLAAIANSLVLFFGVLGQLIGGWASDKLGSSRVIIVSSIGITASMLFLLLIPLGFAGIVLFVIFYGVFFFGHQPAMTDLLGNVSPKNMVGLAYGVMFFFTFGLGSVSTTIAGYLADKLSLEIAFWIMTLFSFLALIIALIIPKVIKK